MVDHREQLQDRAEERVKKQDILTYIRDEHPRKITALEVSGAVDMNLQEVQTLLEQLARSADIESRPNAGRYANRYWIGSE